MTKWDLVFCGLKSGGGFWGNAMGKWRVVVECRDLTSSKSIKSWVGDSMKGRWIQSGEVSGQASGLSVFGGGLWELGRKPSFGSVPYGSVLRGLGVL